MYNGYDFNRQTLQLKPLLKDIRINISKIRVSEGSKASSDELNILCRDTIKLISKAHDIVKENENNLRRKNFRSLLNFLNYASHICRLNIQKKKKKKSIDKEVIKKKTDMELKRMKNDILELKEKVDMINDRFENFENKLNSCMKSLAVSLELLSYNVQKSNYIHEDLKRNNMITNKICYNSNNSLVSSSRNIFNEDQFSFFLKNLLNDIVVKNQEEIMNNKNKPENILKYTENGYDLNFKNNKNLIHYLIQAILKNSKDLLCKIIPQMNMLQRQKVFTTILKIVETRIDECSIKVSDLITNKISIDDKKSDELINENTIKSLSDIFNLNTLSITKNDIAKATWEDSDDSDDDDSDNEINNSNESSYLKSSENLNSSDDNLFKKNKNEILEDIINLLESNNIDLKSKPEG